jgi:hypothetical protein
VIRINNCATNANKDTLAKQKLVIFRALCSDNCCRAEEDSGNKEHMVEVARVEDITTDDAWHEDKGELVDNALVVIFDTGNVIYALVVTQSMH